MSELAGLPAFRDDRSHGMSIACRVASPSRCSTAPVEIPPAARLAHKRVRCTLSLVARSAGGRYVQIDSEPSSSSTHTRDILKHVSPSARQQLADCEANASLGDTEVRSLLLRIAAFHYLWCRFHAESDSSLCDINKLISKIVEITQLLAGGTSQHALQTIE